MVTKTLVRLQRKNTVEVWSGSVVVDGGVVQPVTETVNRKERTKSPVMQREGDSIYASSTTCTRVISYWFPSPTGCRGLLIVDRSLSIGLHLPKAISIH
jgi:hypothetical protein